MTSRPLLKPILGLCLIFVLGVLAGFLFDRIVIAREIKNVLNGPEPMVALLQRRLTKDLSLDSAQQAQLATVLHDTAGKIREARRPVQPQVRAVYREAQQQIEAILRPDQLEKYRHDLETARQRFPKSAYFSTEATDSAAPASEPVGTGDPATNPSAAQH